jgi:adenylate cyclase
MYVSEEVAAVALGEGGALPGGHRQAAAVMFCDLRGFSTYAARFPPERVVAELNDYLVAMVTEIQREGGVVDKYIGDSIMAVFGVPRALPDAASRALRASVGMQRALAAHNVQRAAAGLPALHHDIGLHFGEVVVGNIGTPERMQYTVVGDAVSVASRLQAAAREAGVAVLASSAVVEVAGPMEGVEKPASHGVILVPGRPEGVNAFVVVSGSP